MGSQGPERTCIGCGQKRPKAELFRLVVGPGGEPTLDRSQDAPGRGAYLCGAGCLRAAVKRKAFHRAFRGQVKVLEPTKLQEKLERKPS